MKGMAKKHFLDELKKDLNNKMGEKYGDKVKDMKKVTVMSPSPEGLGEGLSLAQKLLKSKMGMEESEKPMEMEEGLEQIEEKHDLPSLWEDLRKLSKDEMMQTVEYLNELMNKNPEESEEMMY